MATYKVRTVKDGSKRYDFRVRVMVGGKFVTRCKSFRRITQGRQWAASQETAIREKRDFGKSRHTVTHLVQRYIDLELGDLSPSEQRKRFQRLNWWNERIGNCLVDEVTPDIILEHRNSIPGSNATKNRYLAALRKAWSVAMKEWHWTDKSPPHMVALRPEPKGRVRYLSSDERERLLESCKASEEPCLYPIVALALTTGARQDEIMSLRWEQVDFERNVIYLTETKNTESRQLALSGWVVELLEEHGMDRHLGGDRLFPRKYPRSYFETAVRRAGIEDFTFHDLRHTFASYLAMNGASLLDIKEAGGWKTVAMVSRYAHLCTAHVAKVVRGVDFRGMQVG